MPDLNPVTVTAPAYIWRPVLDAIRRAAYRAQRRARAHPPAHGGGNTNDLAADALGQALSAIEAAIDAAAVAASGLDECQASVSDGECIHQRCPNGGSHDIPRSCPLPWHRYNRALEEE